LGPKVDLSELGVIFSCHPCSGAGISTQISLNRSRQTKPCFVTLVDKKIKAGTIYRETLPQGDEGNLAVEQRIIRAVVALFWLHKY